MFVEVLSATEEEFTAYVNNDLRERCGTSCGSKTSSCKCDRWSAIHEALRSPQCIDRLLATLKKIKRNIEAQFANDKAERSTKKLEVTNKQQWLKYVAERDRWKADSLRVKNSIDNAIDEVKLLIREQNTNYREAILRHKEAVLSCPDDSDTSVWDDELWSLVE